VIIEYFANICSAFFFCAWILAIILVCKREKNKKKKERFLFMAVPVWLSISVQGVEMTLIQEFYTVRTLLSWYVPPKLGPSMGYVYGFIALDFVRSLG